MTSERREKFWMVWREDGNAPRYRHWSKASAMDEATRLAKQNPGEVFFVLKATGGVVADEPNVKDVELFLDLIPF